MSRYRRAVAKFLASHPLDEAMALAVGGGDYRRTGKVESEVLAELGLRPGHFIVDIDAAAVGFQRNCRSATRAERSIERADS
jgi:hypothetical protein